MNPPLATANGVVMMEDALTVGINIIVDITPFVAFAVLLRASSAITKHLRGVGGNPPLNISAARHTCICRSWLQAPPPSTPFSHGVGILSSLSGFGSLVGMPGKSNNITELFVLCK